MDETKKHIDELVATVLSQHTSDTNSERAFAQLKARFPSWQQVTDAPVEQVASAIRCGGILRYWTLASMNVNDQVPARELLPRLAGSWGYAAGDNQYDITGYANFYAVRNPEKLATATTRRKITR